MPEGTLTRAVKTSRAPPRRAGTPAGSKYPGEPVLRLAEDVEKLLVRGGQPAPGEPGDQLLRGQETARLGQRARQPAHRLPLGYHQLALERISLDAPRGRQPFVHGGVRAGPAGPSFA